MHKPLKSKWQQKWLRMESVHPTIQSLANAVEVFCGNWFFNLPEKSLLVIVGDFGSGKTHAAKCVFKFCSAGAVSAFETRKWPGSSFPRAIYISWPEAASEFNEKNFSVMTDAFESELVILDDIGAENDPWKICADRLCQILSRRENKFTIVTTNVQPAEWATRFDGRINDRLLRNSVVIDLTGVPSYAMKA